MFSKDTNFIFRKSHSLNTEKDSQEKLVDQFIILNKHKTLFEMTGSETRSIYQLLSKMEYFKKIRHLIKPEDYWNIASNLKIVDYKSSTIIYKYGINFIYFR